MKEVNLPLTIKVFREGTSKEAPIVAYNPDLDISSCGKTEDEARRMLEKAIRLFLRGAREDGTLNQILAESGLATAKGDKEYPKTYFSLLNFPLVVGASR